MLLDVQEAPQWAAMVARQAVQVTQGLEGVGFTWEGECKMRWSGLQWLPGMAAQVGPGM